MVFGIGEIHAHVRAQIDAKVPGYAQGELDGLRISWHPGIFGGMTFTGTSSVKDAAEMEGLLIDGTVRGNVVASPGTFLLVQYKRRAEYYRERSANPTQADKDFAVELDAYIPP